jgi:heme/copper-type cytochrome/quinol oxidase subunit 2
MAHPTFRKVKDLKTKLVTWFLFATAALMAAFAPLTGITNHSPEKRTFRLEASQYAYSPGEITVNMGDTVSIDLVSTDVVHGLYVDGYGLSITADPGQTARLTFVADKAGSFRLRCNVTCGAMHPFMVGKLNVGVNTWLYRSIALAGMVVLGAILYGNQKTKSEKSL